jgi:hypothetical protein
MRFALIFLFLAGCASAPPQVLTVEKVVTVQTPPTFQPIPPELFAGCTAPIPAGPTNGDLLVHDHAEADFAACLQNLLDGIKALK